MHNHKVALITGSTHGIGKGIALALARENYSVIINGATTKALSQDYVNALISLYEQEARYLYVQADVSKKKDRQSLIDQIKNNFERIDILINNAGVGPKERENLLETSEESYDWVMGVNLKGPFFLTQAIANWMIELRNIIHDYHPYIINISSISRYAVSVNRGEYCISKAGLNMVTKLFAVRLAEFEIPVLEISPGIIKTPLTEKVQEKYDKLIGEGITPLKRWGTPEDIAKPVLAIVKGLIPFSTGATLEIDGGFHLKRL